MKRVVQPELLDGLPYDDPAALRSRRDIRMVNRIMGNFRWVRERAREIGAGRVLELGAGDGGLLESLAGDGRELAGVDLAPRPPGLPDEVRWLQRDVRGLAGDEAGRGAIVVANHFLHHFGDEDLRALGRALSGCAAILACEPLRSRRVFGQGALLWPFINRVTRHDMVVSIRAGFRRGELPSLLGLEAADWKIDESVSWSGACRLVARRR